MRSILGLILSLFLASVALGQPVPSGGCSCLPLAGGTVTGTANFAGIIAENHPAGYGTAPTVAANAGAGTGPTIGFSDTPYDSDFTVSLTTGTTPTASATVFTVTFASTWTQNVKCVFSPAGGTAGAGLDLALSTTTTQLTFLVGATALAPSTLYFFNFICMD